MGAAAGGLVVHGHNGLVFRAGDASELATRMSTLASAPALRERLGERAREDASRLTPAAWAEGVGAALAATSTGRDR